MVEIRNFFLLRRENVIPFLTFWFFCQFSFFWVAVTCQKDRFFRPFRQGCSNPSPFLVAISKLSAMFLTKQTSTSWFLGYSKLLWVIYLRSEDQKWSPFSLAITRILNCITHYVFDAVRIFLIGFFSKKESRSILNTESLDLCQTREEPRFHLKWNGTLSLFLWSCCLVPRTEPWKPCVFFASDSWQSENAKKALFLTCAFSNSFFSSTTSVTFSCKCLSDSSLLE